MYTDILNWISSQQTNMEATLKTWALINTGTENTKGLALFAAKVQTAFQQLECEYELVNPIAVKELTNNGDVRQVPAGKCLRFFKNRPNKQKVLLAGHMDTVFPVDHPFQTLTPLSDRRLQGPGVTDMKGGILVLLHALIAFEKTPLASELSWEVFLNADEETGSRGSMPALLQSAKTADFGLAYEPCMPHGAFAGARKGSANYGLLVQGKTAHAGRELAKGRNAITALSQFMLQLEALNTSQPGIGVNIARIHGGGPLNVVPDKAVGHFNIRVQAPEQQIWLEDYLAKALAKANTLDGLSFELFGGFTRPPKLIDKPTEALCQLVQRCGETLGITITFEATGGCCDGNNIAALGVPTIDTLGVKGANIHSSQEFIELDSLSERAKLSFLILIELAQLKSKKSEAI